MADSGRQALRMTEDEIVLFLAEERRVQVATIGPRGWPHVVPMAYFLADGSIHVWTDGDSAKVRNLRSDDRVSCLVEQGDGLNDYRAVQVEGRAILIEEYERSREVGRQLFERYSGGPLDEATSAYLDTLAHVRVGVRIEPERVVSWDHRKMAVDLKSIGS